jgi:hypothetical protein
VLLTETCSAGSLHHRGIGVACARVAVTPVHLPRCVQAHAHCLNPESECHTPQVGQPVLRVEQGGALLDGVIIDGENIVNPVQTLNLI